MHDLVIRGGTVIDGSGAARVRGDVAIQGDCIVEVGAVSGRGRREIDATDRLVTPGWVDVHTHYDGQATWDPILGPSSWHGVTTVVVGNCGVGFAPVRPGQQQFLIELMEGVEDIPCAARRWLRSHRQVRPADLRAQPAHRRTARQAGAGRGRPLSGDPARQPLARAYSDASQSSSDPSLMSANMKVDR